MSSEAMAATNTEVFFSRDATLESLYEAGWYIEHSSQGGWWFRNKNTHQIFAVPRWVYQAVDQALDCGMQSVAGQLKQLMSGKGSYLGPCPPWTPDPKKAKKRK